MEKSNTVKLVIAVVCLLVAVAVVVYTTGMLGGGSGGSGDIGEMQEATPESADFDGGTAGAEGTDLAPPPEAFEKPSAPRR